MNGYKYLLDQIAVEHMHALMTQRVMTEKDHKDAVEKGGREEEDTWKDYPRRHCWTGPNNIKTPTKTICNCRISASFIKFK